MLSNTFVTKILEEIADLCYIACHFDNPTIAGAYASEVSGGGYARVLTPFTEPANRSIWSTQPVVFSGMTSTRVTHIGGWNGRSEGDLLFIAELPAPITVSTGGGFQLLAGEIAVSLA